MSDSVDRRQFLGRSALSGAAAGLALGTLQARAADAPSNRVVVGVMGLSRGRALAQGFAKQPGVEVKYVCDIDKNRTGAAAGVVEKASGKAPQEIHDFRKILDDKDVDALICAAPNHWHAPATILGCSAGKNVYVEKPCCHNPREGELMVAAARKNNRAVQMGSQRRSGPSYIEAMKQLRDGVIGRVYCARSYYSNERQTIGTGTKVNVPSNINYDLWQGPAARRDYVSNLVHYNWHWRWHWGNGELGNNGVHALDICRWGLEVDYPISVTSSGGRYRYSDDQETPDTHIVGFEFAEGKSISWQGHSCNRHNHGFVTFYGETGTLAIGGGGEYTVYDHKDKIVKQVKPTTRGDAEHIDNFVSAIRDEKPLGLNAEIETGYKSTLLCLLGNIAHRTGRTLHCDSSDGKIKNDPDAMKLWTREYETGWEPRV